MHAHPRLMWTAGWLLALVGVAVYLLYPTTVAFWAGFGLTVPLLALVAFRQSQMEPSGRSDDSAPFDAPLV